MKYKPLILLTLIPVFAFAQNPASTTTTVPTLDHDQRVQLFSYDDQRNAILEKYQKEYLAEVKPVQDAENAYIQTIEKAHPGYSLVPDPQTHGWVFRAIPPVAKKK